MKTISLLALVGALMLTGCTHTRMVDFNQDANPSFATINRLAQEKKAMVTLMDQRVITVRSLQVTPDSTSWLDAEEGRFETVATADIEEVRFVSHGMGGAEGLGIGVLTGLAFGAIVGFAYGDDPPCGEGSGWFCVSLNAGEKAAIVGAIGGAGLGMVGLIGGLAAGRKEVYHFQAPFTAPPVVVEDVKQQRPKR